MPRAKYNADEADPNFKIEDGVRFTFKSSAIAQVSVSALEKVYDLPDEKVDTLQKSVEDKCRAVAEVVDADFEIRGESVWFRRHGGIEARCRRGGGRSAPAPP